MTTATAVDVSWRFYLQFPECLPPAATILSTIPHNDRISTQARSHGEKTLIKFHKEVWWADLSNYMFPPEVYLPDHLIKEILNRFSQLNSLETVKTFLEPHDHLKSEGSSLFGILQTLKVDFDCFTVVKKLGNEEQMLQSRRLKNKQ